MSNPYEQQQPAPNMGYQQAYAPPPPDYGMMPPGHGHHHQPMRNGLGIAALVLGIIGTLTGLIPLLFFIAGTLGLLAVIFGFVGRGRAGKGIASNGGVALSGAILGLISMGLATWGLVVTVNVVSDTATQLNETLSSPGAMPKATKSQAPKPLALGAIANEPPFRLRVMSVSREQTVSSSIDSHRAQGSYVVVRILVKNSGNSPATFDGTDSGLLDAKAKQYAVDTEATISQNLETGKGLYDTVNPGQKITRVLVFDIPKTATPVVISMFGAENSAGSFMYLVKDSELMNSES
ncbi:DUF4190 domain-containing protein [Sphaerisporangium siamense]|uniref:Glycerol-3-phosphate acyltransferase PlsY n=1 Tax=Sphaerisporangium siamense TaxID=795645 RepID=A0A7W7D437_9ACTN|nr:DUF4190 domain-containing protein [Sphaerisporangium siamense]MBB4699959.1 glycerol-3-phosphate acyltransferase PlsY [Sphaerisporangium siamense]